MGLVKFKPKILFGTPLNGRKRLQKSLTELYALYYSTYNGHRRI